MVKRAAEERWTTVGAIGPTSILLAVRTFVRNTTKKSFVSSRLTLPSPTGGGAYEQAYEGPEARHPGHRDKRRPGHLISRMLPRFPILPHWPVSFQDPRGRIKTLGLRRRLIYLQWHSWRCPRLGHSRCFVCGDRPPCFGSVKAIRPKRIRTGLGQ